jgi:hypothetical protein
VAQDYKTTCFALKCMGKLNFWRQPLQCSGRSGGQK